MDIREILAKLVRGEVSIEEAEKLKNGVDKIVSLEPGNEEWRRLLDNLINEVDRFDKLIDRRTEILRGLGE